MDYWLFHNGSLFHAYNFFGAHITDEGCIFRIYAPNAFKVSLIGDFSSWEEIPMKKNDKGVYEVLVKDAKYYMMYKYRIYKDQYNSREHCDPYGFMMELRPNFASIIAPLDEYKFTDEKWMKNRTKSYEEPLNIYEMHLGSWKENPDDKKNHWYTYEDLAPLLIPFLKEHGYNAVEFMPLSEHPADISWGYQNTGFFAPTSRYGKPSQLQYLIDQLHNANIKVIMDFVPVHFAVDSYALANLDTTPLYEYSHKDMAVSEWGSYNFDHSKGIVSSFLCSSANYWLDVYHFDGLRMDAISRIIYYQGNSDKGINHKGLEFMQKLNQGLHMMHKNVILIAEDSSDFPKVTCPVESGGLGFDYKWDMGWMNDTLDFFKKTPEERIENYNKISFSMMYFGSEYFLMPLSHDENVHGKATVLQKMYGNYEDKFKQARAMYMYMFTHPGKKLNFMGYEIGMLREWDETRQMDYFLLKYPLHDSFNRYIKDLNHVYKDYPALYRGDYKEDGFKWIIVDDPMGVTYAYIRKYQNQILLCIFNFSDKYHKDYQYQSDCKIQLEEILNSDWDIYSGTTRYEKDKRIKSLCVRKEQIITAYEDVFDREISPDDEIPEEKIIDRHNNTIYEHYIKLDLPPYSGRIFRVIL